MPTIKELKDTYTSYKMEVDNDSIAAHYVLRPLSWYLTWLCIKLHISNYQAILIGFISNLIACALIVYGLANGMYVPTLFGGLFIFITLVMDYADGNLARYYKKVSQWGGFMDKINDYWNETLLPLAIGTGLYLNNFLVYQKLYIFERIFSFRYGHVYLIAALYWCVSMLMRRLLTETLASTCNKVPRKYYKTGNTLWKLVYKIGVIVERMVYPVFLFCVLFNILHIFLIVWAIVAALDFVTVVLYTLIKGFRDDFNANT